MMLRSTTNSLLRRAITLTETRRIATSSTSSLLLLRAAASSYTSRSFADAAAQTVTNGGSPWSHFPMAPPDPIIGLTEAYLKDDFPDKVRYRTFEGSHYCSQLWNSLGYIAQYSFVFLQWTRSGQCRRGRLSMRSGHAVRPTCCTRGRK